MGIQALSPALCPPVPGAQGGRWPASGSSWPPHPESPEGIVSRGMGSLFPSPPNKAALSGGSEGPTLLPGPLQPPVLSSERHLYLCPRPDCWEGAAVAGIWPAAAATLTPGLQRETRDKGCPRGAVDQSPAQRRTRGPHRPPASSPPCGLVGHSIPAVNDMALCAAPALWEEGTGKARPPVTGPPGPAPHPFSGPGKHLRVRPNHQGGSFSNERSFEKDLCPQPARGRPERVRIRKR